MQKIKNSLNLFVKFIKYYIAICLILIVLMIIGIFFVLTWFELESVMPLVLMPELNLASEEPADFQELPDLAPDIVKAIYITSWSASKESHIDYVIDIAKTTEINAVVIDVKDFSGYIAYDIVLPEVKEYGSRQIRIRDIDSLIQRFHEERIYVIARISVFQDPILARARPDLAIHSKSKLSSAKLPSFSSLWLDDMGLAWIDPAAKEAWNYNIAIARDAANRGFDELNFDYVRFPSDGDLQDMDFPFWNGTTSRHIIIREFFKHLRQELPGLKISVDLFGLSTVSYNDLGVGQIIEDAYEYFDYVCPMVYPSHYADGFLGHQEPAEHPYEVVKHSMENALRRLIIYNQSHGKNAKLRPWLQDFNLGALYNKEMVRSEIEAVYEATGDNFKGFMLWNSENFYTKDALRPIDLNF